jgi:hypothetical protein
MYVHSSNNSLTAYEDYLPISRFPPEYTCALRSSGTLHRLASQVYYTDTTGKHNVINFIGLNVQEQLFRNVGFRLLSDAMLHPRRTVLLLLLLLLSYLLTYCD